MRIRLAKGFTIVVALPGVAVQSARLVGGGIDAELETEGGTIQVPASVTNVVPTDAGVIHCEMVVNGDKRYPCEVIANPVRPNRR